MGGGDFLLVYRENKTDNNSNMIASYFTEYLFKHGIAVKLIVIVVTLGSDTKLSYN